MAGTETGDQKETLRGSKQGPESNVTLQLQFQHSNADPEREKRRLDLPCNPESVRCIWDNGWQYWSLLQCTVSHMYALLEQEFQGDYHSRRCDHVTYLEAHGRIRFWVQFVEDPTRGEALLGLVIANNGGLFGTVTVCENLGNSDHNLRPFHLNCKIKQPQIMALVETPDILMSEAEISLPYTAAQLPLTSVSSELRNLGKETFSRDNMKGKFFALCLMAFAFLFGYFFCYQSKIEVISKRTQHYVKLQERNKPVNNKTYPAFRHPLAPPYPYPYKFLINQPDKCKNRKPYLVIMVCVASHDVASRRTIRETWGNESIYDVDVVRIFLVGLPQVSPDQTQRLLEEESEAFGDVIQQDFMDTYNNLTLKTLMGMEWVTKFCSSASYVMKVDGDIFLNVDYLVHELLHPDLPVRNNYYTGQLYFNARPCRNKGDKWYLPKEIYPNNTYPPYCAGPGYVFSADLAKKIYDVAQEIRVIHIEDVFIGLCLYELHILPTDPPKDKFNTDRIEYDICKFKNVIIVHHYAGKELRSVWADFWAKKSQKC
ncbi:beta-1,3-galactosyltransferase 2-like [Leptodactylus fuscus]|uniref:beta-1,3-galactosyltransferase 2-like n=1 Tax=Leptodactylus fuscus TaxID=238119 RepID=UPI003F4EE011